MKEDSTRSISTPFQSNDNEVSLVPLISIFNSKLSKEEEDILLIKKEDKLFEENEDMYEVIYPNEGELLDDVHSCEEQDPFYDEHRGR